MSDYIDAYKKLNAAQKEAVDTLEGPVMVVAGPGTGKTQVLTLRIAHILESTDTPPSGILCLTFTRSGVSAMQSRLESYIGDTARDVKITTFHSFAIELIEKYYTLLGFSFMPKLLDDVDNVLLFDEILENYEWTYIRPRTNPQSYFGDMFSLLSLLKRESITKEQFLDITQTEIDFLKNDESSISSRGARKGEIKKEVLDKIENLNKTLEFIRFYEIYESLKKDRGLMDYDDVLAYAVELVAIGDDVRAELYENYLYVLIDEHQDSSGIQNAFLKAVWQDIEKPNIFIVGDDRQLIYGFSGAQLDYFTEFKHIFGKAKLITLIENYRSTQDILTLSDTMLKSHITDALLKSNQKKEGSIELAHYAYPRDEIIAAGLYFQSQIKEGVPLHECALLVPKNYQVRSAVGTLQAMGLPVTSDHTASLFQSPYFAYLRQIIAIVNNPVDSVVLTDIILEPFFGVAPIQAHVFLKNVGARVQIEDLIREGEKSGLFGDENKLAQLGEKLASWINTVSSQKISFMISTLGNEVLIETAPNHTELLDRVEIVRSFIHLALSWEEKNPTKKIADFLAYITRLESYGQNIPVASFGLGDGIHVITLHKSKGLEYEHVWIGHMNEEVLMTEKRSGFTLPEKIKDRMHSKDIASVTRELYVALTRAKSHVTFSYAQHDYKNTTLTLSRILENLPTLKTHSLSLAETEEKLLSHGPQIFVKKPVVSDSVKTHIREVQEFVRTHFESTKISVSMLNNFFECPWKWYFRNFLRLPEIKSVSLALGSAVHSTIEYILKESTLPNSDVIQDKIKSELHREGVVDEKEHARLSKEALTIVTSWVQDYYHTLSPNKISERSVGYKDPRFPNLSMYGKIDLTEILSGGEVIVTDFKTGSEKTASVIEKITEEGRLSSYMRQLAMYAYLLKNTDKQDVSQVRLLFLEAPEQSKNKLYSTHIEADVIDMLVHDIQDYNKTLLDGSWIDRPCLYTPYGKERKECEHCARAQKIFIF